MRIFNWCFDQSNPKDPKYDTLTYQLYTAIAFLLLATSLGMMLTSLYESMFPQIVGHIDDQTRIYVGTFILVYYLILMVSRLICHGLFFFLIEFSIINN